MSCTTYNYSKHDSPVCFWKTPGSSLPVFISLQVISNLHSNLANFQNALGGFSSFIQQQSLALKFQEAISKLRGGKIT